MTRKLAAGLFIAGLASAGWQMNWLPEAAFGPGYEPLNVALSLWHGSGFANPYDAAPTGPTAHIAPFLPVWLALWLRVFGYTPMFAAFVTVGMMALRGAIAVMLPVLSLKYLGSAKPGYWATSIVAALPVLPLAPQFEAEWALAAVLAYHLLPDRWLLRGIAAGLCLYVSPTLLLVLAPDALARRRFLRWAAIVFLVCLPWNIRNYVVLGQFTWIRNNLPLELWVSNNPQATPLLWTNLDAMRALHPCCNAAAAADLKRLGERDWEAGNLRRFGTWVRNNTGRFLALTGQRMVQFWFPLGHYNPVTQITFWVITVLALFSLKSLPRAWLVALAAYPLIYYVVQTEVRYRTPVLWITLLGAGIVLERLRLRFWARTTAR